MVLAVVALLAGCGGGDSEEAAASETVSEFLTALAEGDGGRACAHLTESARGVVETAAGVLPDVPVVTCSAVLERIGELIPAESKEQLRDLPEGIGPEDARIEGETAVVTVPGARLPIRLIDSERGWLITDDTMRQLLELER